MRRGLASLGIALASIASLTVANGRPQLASASSFGERFDSRASAPGIRPSRTQTAAIVALVREHPDVRFDWNERFGTPSTVLRFGKALAGPVRGTADVAARTWLRSHAALFGWTAQDVSALKAVKTLAQPREGPIIVLFHQLFGGLEGHSFGGSIVVGLDRANRVLTVRANAVRTPSLARGRRLSAADALRVASGGTATKLVGHRNGWLEFARGPFPFNHSVRHIAFPTGGGPARPAWEVDFTKRMNSRYRTVIDASTGAVLYRRQLVVFEAPEGRVFQNHPGAKRGGTHEMVSFKGDTTASPNGWLLPAPPFTTVGNNAITATHWIAGQAPEGPGQVRPYSATGTFDVAFQNAWNESDCGGSLPVYGPGVAPTYALDAEPAVLNLFYHHNVMHDYFYGLGFDEKAGAMQTENFGRGGKGNDPLFGLSQAGATVLLVNSDNAYMSTSEDGRPSWSGMFLFLPVPGAPFPCVDGSFDSEIIYHEYTHAVSNRWVGGEFGNLDTFQGGSMGESWSDFYGVHYLASRALETNTALGPYATGDPQRGIRNWPMAEVTANYGDIGYDGGPEVHSDGEIWNGLLWDLRTTLAKARKGGADLAAQVVADGMPLAGPHPSMLNARDGILAADLARTKGANQSLIWSVFARHGMGFSAKSKTGDDTDPTPAFDHKDPKRNETIVGRVVDPVSGAPVPGASITISDFSQGVSPFLTTASDGSFRLRLAEGVHSITFSLPGYGSQVVRLPSVGGRTRTGEFSIGSNYASKAIGAKVVAFSSEASPGNAGSAIDDAEGSTWASENATKEQFLVVKLAGTVPVDVAAFRLSAFTLERANSLKKWTILTSIDGKAFTQRASGTFPVGHLGPAVNDMVFRTIRLPHPVKASFVKLVASSAQDPDASSIRVAELQAIGRGDGFKAKALKAVVFGVTGSILRPLPPPAWFNGAEFPATGITAAVFEHTCVYPPPTQSIDGFVVELPDGYGDGRHRFTMTYEPQMNDPVLISEWLVWFDKEDCSHASAPVTVPLDGGAAIPEGTKYVVLEMISIAAGDFTFEASASTPVILSRVGIPKKPLPRVEGRKQLAATGVGSAWPAGLGLIGAGGAFAFALRRRTN